MWHITGEVVRKIPYRRQKEKSSAMHTSSLGSLRGAKGLGTKSFNGGTNSYWPISIMLVKRKRSTSQPPCYIDPPAYDLQVTRKSIELTFDVTLSDDESFVWLNKNWILERLSIFPHISQYFLYTFFQGQTNIAITFGLSPDHNSLPRWDGVEKIAEMKSR